MLKTEDQNLPVLKPIVDESLPLIKSGDDENLPLPRGALIKNHDGENLPMPKPGIQVPPNHNIIIRECAPLNIGLKNNDETLFVMIKKNTPYPCQASCVGTTWYKNQESLDVEVFEGVNLMAKDCHKMGQF